MPSPAPASLPLLGLTRRALVAAAAERLPHGAGLAAAIHRRAHRSGVFDPSADGAGPAAAEAWRHAFALELPELVRTVTEPAAHGGTTAKAVLGYADGAEVETVRIPIGTRRESQCLSTQVGCGMACRFCETARMGRVRQLEPHEIVAQVVTAKARLGWDPKTLVFQGMGEPLDNVDALFAAIDVLTDPAGLGFGHDRLTICTAGHVDGLERLAARGVGRLNLSLSLNAADDATRDGLMPIGRRWPLAAVQDVLRRMRPRRNWQLGIHWCLMPGINDRAADAAAIAAFCAPLGRVMVHLIPYNPGSVPLTRAPTEDEVVRFVGRLREHGLPVRRRITKGRSVMAACGQLGDRGLRRRMAAVAGGKGQSASDAASRARTAST